MDLLPAELWALVLRHVGPDSDIQSLSLVCRSLWPVAVDALQQRRKLRRRFSSLKSVEELSRLVAQHPSLWNPRVHPSFQEQGFQRIVCQEMNTLRVLFHQQPSPELRQQMLELTTVTLAMIRPMLTNDICFYAGNNMDGYWAVWARFHFYAFTIDPQAWIEQTVDAHRSAYTNSSYPEKLRRALELAGFLKSIQRDPEAREFVDQALTAANMDAGEHRLRNDSYLIVNLMAMLTELA